MEAAILKFFENIRNPFLDYFFGFFTLLGEEFVVAGIILVLYLLWNKALGERVLLTLLTATTMTTALKGIGRMRPYAANVVSAGNITVDDLGASSSFPSGHATCISAMCVGLSIPFYKKKAFPIVTSIGSVLIVLVSLSRLYFGVHYPTDILAGLAVGTLSAILWTVIYSKFYNYRQYVFLAIALLSLFLLFIPVLHKNDNMAKMSALMLSVAAFLFFEKYVVELKNPTKWLHRLYRILILGTIAVILYLPLHFLPKNNVTAFFKILILASGTLFASTTLFKIFNI